MMIYERKTAGLSTLEWAKKGLSSAVHDVIHKPAPSGLSRKIWADLGLSSATEIIDEVKFALAQPKFLLPGEEIVFE